MKVWLAWRKLCLLSVALALPFAALANDEGRDNDPLEGFNRAMFSFNDTADRWALKPVARGYRAVTPDPIERGVARMFGNLGEVLNVVNDVLQGKLGQAGNDGGRFIINSTVGVAGFDVAEHWGLPKSDGEDFGQTFATWGAGQGPYLVLPFLAPVTSATRREGCLTASSIRSAMLIMCLPETSCMAPMCYPIGRNCSGPRN